MRKKLIDLDKSQNWLSEQVKEKTGLFMDHRYMTKILNGQRGAPKVIEAINEILGLDSA